MVGQQFEYRKMNKARLVTLILLSVFVFCLGLLELRRGGQYRLGMSLAEVRQLSEHKYPAQRLWFCQEQSPPESLETEWVCMYDSEAGILLFFSQHEVLIRKTRIKYFGVNVPKFIDSFRR